MTCNLVNKPYPLRVTNTKRWACTVPARRRTTEAARRDSKAAHKQQEAQTRCASDSYRSLLPLGKDDTARYAEAGRP